MLYILWGPDSFSIAQALGEIKRGLGEPENLAANTASLDGRQVSIDQLRMACETMPFLASHRLVVLEGLLERFETAGKNTPKKQLRTNSPGYKPFADYIRGIPDFTVLVLLEGKLSAKNPLLLALSSQAEVRSFPLLRGDQLKRWITRRVTGAGGSISAEAVEMLANILGGDLWAMSSEIDKLVTFTWGRRIEPGDIRAAVSHAQESSIFAMIDAILDHQAGLAEKTLEELTRHGSAPVYILTMLSRQAGLVARARNLLDSKRPKAEIQEKLGLPDYALRKTLAQAERYTLSRLKEIYDRLLDTDIAIKTGRLEGGVALNLFIADMAPPIKPGNW